MKKILKGINYLVMFFVVILPVILGIYLYNNGAGFFPNGNVEIFSLINGVLLIIAILLLPFAIFKFNRGIIGKIYMLFGYLNILLLWIWSTLHVFGFWGWPGLIIGGIFLGVGVIIIGLGTFIYYNLWGQVWSIIYAGFITFLFMYIGNKLVMSYEKTEKNSKKSKVKVRNKIKKSNNDVLKKLDRYMRKELNNDKISNVFESVFEIIKLRNNQLDEMTMDAIQMEEYNEEEGNVRISFIINNYRYNFYSKKIDIGNRRHFFIRIQNAKKRLKASAIIGFNEEANSFEDINSDFLPDSYLPYLKVISFQFDNNQYGVIFWYSYRFDSRYNVLKYEENQYKRVNISSNMQNGHLVPSKIKTGKITNIEYGNWENKPVQLNYEFLSMADLSKYRRKFEISYKWNNIKNKFDIEDWEEVYNVLSIVNLFLENYFNKYVYEAKNFVVANSNLYNRLFVDKSLNINELVSNHMIVLSPVRSYIENSHYSIDNNNELLKVGVFDIKSVNSVNKDSIFNLENLTKVLNFELTKEHNPRIVNIHAINKRQVQSSVSKKENKNNHIKEKEKQAITPKKLLIKLEKIKREYGKVMEENSYLMYSDKTNLPYSKKVIRNTLKILAVYACFSGQKSLFNLYKIAYDQIANFQNLSDEEKEDIKIFNDFSLINRNNKEIMKKINQNNGNFDSDLEEMLYKNIAKTSSFNQELYDDFARISNIEYESNNRNFNAFINNAKGYMKNNNLNESYFADFEKFYSYLEVKYPELITEIYHANKKHQYY